MTLQAPPGNGGGLPAPPALPTRGVFATSEVLPLLSAASRKVAEAGGEWRALREEADLKKSEAKRLRANLIVRLRAFGNEVTGGVPIKTSAERQEWADADADVIAAELAADLAQTVQMAAREAYQDAQSYFETLRALAAIERDEMRREHAGPPR